MVTKKANVYLLCGLPGSGKTTYAKKLKSKKDVIYLSIDDAILDRYGRYGIDFQAEKYGEYKAVVIGELKSTIVSMIERQREVILDFGLWRESDREGFKKLVENAGGKPKVLYFKASKELIKERLSKRNEKQEDNLPPVDEKMLNGVLAIFEEPTGDDVKVIEQT